jgi:hypothetical protein
MMFSNWQVADFNELFRSGWPPGVDPRRTVVLEREPPGIAQAAAGAVGSARLLRYANTEVVVEVSGEADGILVLNDVWHPWWRVTVDGAEAELLKANAVFRAVVVPRGTHTVRFSFHPFMGTIAEVVAKLRGTNRP